MTKKVHTSVSIFLLAGLAMAVSAVLQDLNRVLNYGAYSQDSLIRLLAVPGLYIGFSLIALIGRRRGVVSFLRFLLFAVILGNLAHTAYTGLMFAGLIDRVREFLGPDIAVVYQVLEASPRMGIHSFFSLTGWYPLYEPGTTFTPYVANIVSVSILSWVFGRYTAAAKKKRESAAEDREETRRTPAAPAVHGSPSMPSVMSALITGKQEDLVDRLYRQMMEEEAASKVVINLDKHGAAPASTGLEDTRYEEPSFRRRKENSRNPHNKEGHVPWVLCAQSPRAAEHYSAILAETAGARFKSLGEGTVLVQEHLNTYQGLRELDRLLPEGARGAEARALPFNYPPGSPGVVLFAE
ncbi:MAG: hypothetical protein JXB03_01775 [Spirochaetales bacterium]|nr:hypothetical protein [Spirochaetales bacterium]